MEKKHIAVVIGTRPEAIKLAPVVRALRNASWARATVVLTGQHRSLLESSLKDFGLTGDINLSLMEPGQTLSAFTGRAFPALESAIAALSPDLLLAQGDTTTVMAAAVTCFYMQVPFGHVEAGLRTGNLNSPFPEEFNRVVAGKLALLHFAPTDTAARALKAEGVPDHRVFLTGNTVIDALAYASRLADETRFRAAEGRQLILLTTHRRENFGAPLKTLLYRFRQIIEQREDLELLFPAHPNPAVQAVSEQTLKNHPRIHVVEPLGYVDFVGAMKAAALIVTDSGGVQEEAPFLRKPVVVIRSETERPDAVSAGVARLVGTDPDVLEQSLSDVLDDPTVRTFMSRGVSPYGDGKASARILAALEQYFQLSHTAGPYRPFVAEEPPTDATNRCAANACLDQS